jgi:hypothetical protein
MTTRLAKSRLDQVIERIKFAAFDRSLVGTSFHLAEAPTFLDVQVLVTHPFGDVNCQTPLNYSELPTVCLLGALLI